MLKIPHHLQASPRQLSRFNVPGRAMPSRIAGGEAGVRFSGLLDETKAQRDEFSKKQTKQKTYEKHLRLWHLLEEDGVDAGYRKFSKFDLLQICRELAEKKPIIEVSDLKAAVGASDVWDHSLEMFFQSMVKEKLLTSRLDNGKNSWEHKVSDFGKEFLNLRKDPHGKAYVFFADPDLLKNSKEQERAKYLACYAVNVQEDTSRLRGSKYVRTIVDGGETANIQISGIELLDMVSQYVGSLQTAKSPAASLIQIRNNLLNRFGVRTGWMSGGLSESMESKDFNQALAKALDTLSRFGYLKKERKGGSDLYAPTEKGKSLVERVGETYKEFKDFEAYEDASDRMDPKRTTDRLIAEALDLRLEDELEDGIRLDSDFSLELGEDGIDDVSLRISRDQDSDVFSLDEEGVDLAPDSEVMLDFAEEDVFGSGEEEFDNPHFGDYRLARLKNFSATTADGKTGWQVLEALERLYAAKEKSWWRRFLSDKGFTFEKLMQEVGSGDVKGMSQLVRAFDQCKMVDFDFGWGPPDNHLDSKTKIKWDGYGRREFLKGNPFLKDEVTPDDWIALIQQEIDQVEKRLESRQKEFKTIEDEFKKAVARIPKLRDESAEATRNAQEAYREWKQLKESNGEPEALRTMEAGVSKRARLAERLQKQLKLEIPNAERLNREIELGRSKFMAGCRELELELERLLEAQTEVRSNRMSALLKELNGETGGDSHESLSERITRLLGNVRASQDGSEVPGVDGKITAEANDIVSALDLEARMARLEKGQAESSASDAESLKATAPVALNDGVNAKKRVKTSS